jgi:7-keto-8-aminopelargonate synthetase-like enzyme
MSTKPSKSNKFINTIDECISNGVKNGIFQVSVEDDILNGREVTINGRKVVSFGSCSYLGLETDDRLKHGAIDATLRYGTQYSEHNILHRVCFQLAICTKNSKASFIKFSETILPF